MRELAFSSATIRPLNSRCWPLRPAARRQRRLVRRLQAERGRGHRLRATQRCCSCLQPRRRRAGRGVARAEHFPDFCTGCAKREDGDIGSSTSLRARLLPRGWPTGRLARSGPVLGGSAAVPRGRRGDQLALPGGGGARAISCWAGGGHGIAVTPSSAGARSSRTTVAAWAASSGRNAGRCRRWPRR